MRACARACVCVCVCVRVCPLQMPEVSGKEVCALVDTAHVFQLCNSVYVCTRSIKVQATVLELLEGIGLGPIAVTMALEADGPRRLGDVLAEAVKVCVCVCVCICVSLQVQL